MSEDRTVALVAIIITTAASTAFTMPAASSYTLYFVLRGPW